MTRLPDETFHRIYAHDDDPWGFRTRWYEKRKYALSAAALPNERYAHAFEPGCSLGVFSEQLAARCDRLTAMELVPSVAENARHRLKRFAHARVITGAIPDDIPTGPFDLVVLSEVGYYLTATGLRQFLEHLPLVVAPTWHLLAVHYRKATDYPLTGDAVHQNLAARYGAPLFHGAEASFVIDVFEGRSE